MNPRAAYPNQAVWKKWLIAISLTMIIFTYLLPVLMAQAGSSWIDESKINTLRSENSAYIPIEQMPPHLWKAFVAIEDHRFMQHDGVDLAALARAIWIDIRSGSYQQGGSTITMQLARNLFLTHDKTIIRKGKEMAIALALERKYSKRELLELYLNAIYYGHGQYGIGHAAQYYFGKGNPDGLRTLTVGESALLASLPKAPESYSPIKHPQKARQRQELVLDRMAQLEILTDADRERALREPILLRGQKMNLSGS